MEDTARWEHEENRERYRQQAFISWQLLSSMFNGDAEPLTFGDYLNMIGLGEKAAAHQEEDVTPEQAIEKAKSILMLLKDGESHD
ncbi:hypothetical protein GFC29_3882 (plasmid) [Anoxybacillus sp. B7M1]|uniref:hypothetical protein n=1 Tax=Anoxybacillus sp. B7M1 TaxID=1490057 RepID=UPI0005CCAF41|nr:hypothetical protein [Anoxybacillus sp. B7M1]ANB66119.1 hypothetical protein GFC29_3882 [Anoxybacillus sp. B7M1]